MKKFLVAGLALSVIAGAGLPAAAQDYRRDGYERSADRRDDRQDRREFRREDRQDRREFRQDLRQDRRSYRAERRYRAGAYHAPRGYQRHNWSVGQRLPRSYYAQPYAIRNYGSYGLYAPPRGYQWTRVGDDAVLTAVASGLIGVVIGGLFF